MNILAIETSCDDTGIAIIKTTGKKPDFHVLSNIVSSQIEIHKKYGGVYPTLAKREHQKNLVPVLAEALKKAKMLKKSQIPTTNDQSNPKSQFPKLKKILEREKELCKNLEKFLNKYEKPNVDLISVTNGPGLEPCLWVGVNFAKALSYYWDIPIVGVNHIEAHILANLVGKKNSKFKTQNFKLPAVCLVASGGHTQLILMKKIGKYKILGETRDDAAGECFDKTAKILGLEYPGGPAIAKRASFLKTKKGLKKTPRQTLRGPSSQCLPRPMIGTKGYDFSFSGLKTAVLYHHKKQPKKIQKSKKYIQEMCAEIQQAIIDVLIKKTIKAAKNHDAKTIILGGGVSANKELRKQFIENCKLKIKNCDFLVPPKNLSTDNAVMIGIAGYFNHKNKKKIVGTGLTIARTIARTGLAKIKAEANLRIK